MELTKRLQDFLEREDILDLLDDRKFNQMYTEFAKYSSSLDVRELSTVLIMLEPDLFEYMTWIPDYFLFGKLRDDVKDWLEDLHVPSTIVRIGQRAFTFCKNIKTIHIPTSVTLIEADSLRAPDLTTIVYEGTQEQWKKIHKEDNWCMRTHVEKLIFTDGELDFKDIR